MKKIEVNASQSYTIYIERGVLRQAGELLRSCTKAQTVVVVSDDHVAPLYGKMVRRSLESAGFRVLEYQFPHGEASKCAATLNALYDFLCENSLTRTDCLAALGGGVVGDLTGFAAATYLRGMDYVQMPTSLLAQVDSSVGGKTAIDLPGGKNLVGAFKQPVAVFCDPDTLQTLPAAFLTDGMGEVIKYGMIWDSALFEMLEQHSLETIDAQLEDMIARCIDIKREVVEQDEFDTGVRMCLNFGHTLGHAIESYYHYQTYTHGCAVAAGMCRMSARTAPEAVTRRLRACVRQYGLPDDVPAANADLVPLCATDKKRANANLRFVVCPEIGRMEIRSMPFEAFRSWMSSDEQGADA